MKFGLFSFLKDKLQFLVLVAIWLLCGMYAGPLVYFVVPVSIFLLILRGYYFEVLVGFFLILTLSDSRQMEFLFAGTLKNIYIVMMGLLLLMRRHEFMPLNRIFMRYMPFLVIASICLFFSPILFLSAQKTFSYFLLMLVVPNYLIRAWRDEGDKALANFIWWGVLILLAGLVLRYLKPDFVTLEGRFTGILGNPNGLGLFCLVFAILFVIISDMRKKLFSRYEFIFIAAVIAISIIYCGSRNALITVLVFLIFRSFSKLSPFLGFLLLIVFIVTYQLILNNIDSIVLTLGLQDYLRIETFDTGSGRIIAWNFGWDWIKKSPILGGGFDFTDDLYRRYYSVLSIMGHQGNAHNSYITFWLDTGVFGLIAYLGATLSNFMSGAKRMYSAFPALYAILFSAFFESWLTASLNPFTIQFVMIMTLISSPVFYEEKAIDAVPDITGEEKPAIV